MVLNDISLIDWSRAQFALTAIYHWLFVPLTLGLSFIVAIFHTMYYKNGDEKWRKLTKFWMNVFGINFAVGVATGIILEFEFGTNWSNYSWIVGDIFGAPLAIEGIVAFFLESVFIAVMFFGWDRVSKRFHMLSSWFVAVGSNLSALWILVANAWMQNPVGTKFNPETVRNEMTSFFDVALSPTALSKFTHTITSSYVVAAIVVIGISSWYLLRNRNHEFAKVSIKVAAIFGFVACILTATTGDTSAYDVAKSQPMKFAAMEGLYDGGNNVHLIVVGYVDTEKSKTTDLISIPSGLSFLATRTFDGYVPGVNDLLYGTTKDTTIVPIKERIEKGKIALASLKSYKELKKQGVQFNQDSVLNVFTANSKHMGYGYFKSEKEAVPNIASVFYSFHLMVIFGVLLTLLLALVLFFSVKDTITKHRWLLWTSIVAIPFVYITSQLGWIVAELGRQPWAIKDMLPVGVAVSDLKTGNVQTTFVLFALLFTILLIVELKILFRIIKKGPENV